MPPPAPIAAPPDYALRSFDAAVNAFKPLMTKSAAKFAGTTHGADVLENVKSFINAVIAAKAKPPASMETAENSAQKRKTEYAKSEGSSSKGEPGR